MGLENLLSGIEIFMLLKNKLRENWVFLGLVFVVFLLGMCGLVKTPQKTSVAENRSLAQFPHLTIGSFIKGTFQGEFEKAISDQFLMSEAIKVNYGQVINNLPTFGINNLFCTNRYTEVPNSTKEKREFFDCGDYMVSYPTEATTNNIKAYKRHVANYNKLNNLADVYYYYVTSYNTINFETGEQTIDVRTMLKNDLEGKYTLGIFDVGGYGQYKKYYYKTDHHWNHIGFYKGYVEISNMMGIKNPIEMPKILTNHDIFYGSHANAILYYDVKEEFEYFDYEFPEHDTYVNGKKSEYGNFKKYKNHDYADKNPVMGYYEYVYGGNNGEVIFDYHNPEAENLLIISNSFGNPIKSLISQHYNKTFAVDLRNYKKATGKDFVPREYIKEHNIDKVLVILTMGFLFSDDVNRGLEN